MTYTELMKKKIGFVSLGCDKNRVDLEKMIFAFKNAGFEIVNSYENANIVLINTCSFILDARKESVEAILEAVPLKNLNLEKLVVTGCLTNMNYSDLADSLPEVDAFVKPSDNEHIVEIVAGLYGVKLNGLSHEVKGAKRVLTTPKHYAYLKIADGCDNFCTYCTIPYIRGRFRSVPMDCLIDEARDLVKNGTKEIILVAQDVTKYGADIYGKPALTALIRKLSEIKDLKLIRLLYCYPDLIDEDLIREIATNEKVAKYIDIPLQHVSNAVLKKMNRRVDYDKICNIITSLKSAIPNIAIRSTFILGFPSETDEDFEKLCEFVKEYKLNNVGFFKYSKEEGTPAGKMHNQIPAKVKNFRLKTISKLQYDNVEKFNKSMVGQVQECVVDHIENGIAILRNQFQCPDVDPIIVASAPVGLKIGDICNVKITGYKKYDLKGEIL